MFGYGSIGITTVSSGKPNGRGADNHNYFGIVMSLKG